MYWDTTFRKVLIKSFRLVRPQNLEGLERRIYGPVLLNVTGSSPAQLIMALHKYQFLVLHQFTLSTETGRINKKKIASFKEKMTVSLRSLRLTNEHS